MCHRLCLTGNALNPIGIERFSNPVSQSHCNLLGFSCTAVKRCGSSLGVNEIPVYCNFLALLLSQVECELDQSLPLRAELAWVKVKKYKILKYLFYTLLYTKYPIPEMEKHADAADASVLFFSLAVLIRWLCTRKLAKKRAVLFTLCYKHCEMSTVLLTLCHKDCAIGTVL